MTTLEQAGFSLIEVLIAVFVLALGVIGTAGMQLTALRTTQQSTFQTTALQLASEMADKMRANDHQMKQADSANPFLQIDYQSALDAEPAAPGVLCYAAACSAEQLAQFDIYEWQTRVKLALPGGRVRICRDASPWDGSVGAYRWTCNASGVGADNGSLVIKIGWQGKGKNPDGSVIQDPKKSFPPSMALTVAPYTK